MARLTPNSRATQALEMPARGLKWNRTTPGAQWTAMTAPARSLAAENRAR
jgi:hypothetical protein